jgi:hypothetical protein
VQQKRRDEANSLFGEEMMAENSVEYQDAQEPCQRVEVADGKYKKASDGRRIQRFGAVSVHGETGREVEH